MNCERRNLKAIEMKVEVLLSIELVFEPRMFLKGTVLMGHSVRIWFLNNFWTNKPIFGKMFIAFSETDTLHLL